MKLFKTRQLLSLAQNFLLRRIGPFLWGAFKYFTWRTTLCSVFFLWRIKWRRFKIALISFCFRKLTSACNCSLNGYSIPMRSPTRGNGPRAAQASIIPLMQEIYFFYTKKKTKTNLTPQRRPEVERLEQMNYCFSVLNPGEDVEQLCPCCCEL